MRTICGQLIAFFEFESDRIYRCNVIKNVNYAVECDRQQHTKLFINEKKKILRKTPSSQISEKDTLVVQTINLKIYSSFCLSAIKSTPTTPHLLILNLTLFRASSSRRFRGSFFTTLNIYFYLFSLYSDITLVKEK